MKRILLLLFGILLVANVMAIGEELSYTPNETMDLKAHCFDENKTECAPGTTCRITIYYPNNSVFVNNQSMFRDTGNTFYNYTAAATSTLGVYNAVIDCNSAATASGYESSKFYVGNPSTEVQTMAINAALYILFGVAILLFIGFLFVKHVPLKWTFFLLSILFIVIAVNTVSISLRNEAGSENIRNIYDKIGAGAYIMYWVCAGLILFIWIFSIFNSISNKRTMEMARRVGQPMDFT